MHRVSVCLCWFASLGAAANLAGTWKFTPPPNPQTPPNRQPREIIYVFKVDGARFTGTLVQNGMADIRNGAIDGTRLTFDRFDANGDGQLDALEILRWLSSGPEVELYSDLSTAPGAGVAVRPAAGAAGSWR